jgi:hypothetical protein
MATVTLDLLPTQSAFYDCEDEFAAFIGGVGSGKTRVASDWTLLGAAKWPLARHFIISNTFAQLKSGTMTTFFEACYRWGLRYVDRIHDKRVMLPDLGATIEIWTADDPDLFRSLEMDRVWVDEAHHKQWTKERFSTLEARTRGSDRTRTLYPDCHRRVRITANPPHMSKHWLVELTTKPLERTGKPKITLFQTSSHENYFLPDGYIDGLRDTMDPELFDIEVQGVFGDIGKGRIWRRFAPGRHVLTPEIALQRGLPALEWEPSLPICWGFDFNLDPLCSVLFQWRRIDVAGYQQVVMYVLGELRIRHSMIDEMLKEFASENADPWLRQAARIARQRGLILYGDASGEAGNRQTGQSDWAAIRTGLGRRGYYGTARVPSSNPKRRDRYNAANAKLENARGQLGVVIHDRCKYLVEDLGTAFYKPGTSDPLIPKIEDGAQLLGHLADAWSYGIVYDFPIKDLPQPPISTVR